MPRWPDVVRCNYASCLTSISIIGSRRDLTPRSIGLGDVVGRGGARRTGRRPNRRRLLLDLDTCVGVGAWPLLCSPPQELLEPETDFLLFLKRKREFRKDHWMENSDKKDPRDFVYPIQPNLSRAPG
ncbi:hypothetical protein BDA96_03G037600 [Sorghum bicolor]|uniref:Uncharacterized protein n=1 Tax=Sorghum bicolor TaxID=4558 RepID=A0A921RBV8_SORBI|nr:hypothetical protein BDA96_03G037600 [Sorghum bicolor]